MKNLNNNIISKRLLIITLASVCHGIFTNSPISAMDYGDIFDTTIYDQKEVLTRLQRKEITDEEVDEELVNALVEAKQKALAKNSLERLKEKILFLQEYTEQRRIQL